MLEKKIHLEGLFFEEPKKYVPCFYELQRLGVFDIVVLEELWAVRPHCVPHVYFLLGFFQAEFAASEEHEDEAII